MRWCLLGWLLLTSAGCSMCPNPYDYAGPTVGPDGQPIGGFGQRAGSVFAPIGPGNPSPQAPTPPGSPPSSAPSAGYQVMPTSATGPVKTPGVPTLATPPEESASEGN